MFTAQLKDVTSRLWSFSFIHIIHRFYECVMLTCFSLSLRKRSAVKCGPLCFCSEKFMFAIVSFYWIFLVSLCLFFCSTFIDVSCLSCFFFSQYFTRQPLLISGKAYVFSGLVLTFSRIESETSTLCFRHSQAWEQPLVKYYYVYL